MSESNPKPIDPKAIDPEAYQLLDEYVHSGMSRARFMKRLMVFASATMSVNALADFLLPKYAQAEQVKPDDPRLTSDMIAYTSGLGAGRMLGLLSRPTSKGPKWPGVIVVHENRGLNPYIKDVARRLSVAQFIALAPDALTPLGGYPGNDDDGKLLQQKRSSEEMLEDFIAAYHYLSTHPQCTGQVGVVGFCFGGAISNQMALRLPNLGAAVPFYGSAPPLERVSEIQAPLLLQFAESDQRVNDSWPAYEAALKQAGKSYTAHSYPGTQHGFHNDTTPRYDKAAAELAWQRTLAFFKQHLSKV